MNETCFVTILLITSLKRTFSYTLTIIDLIVYLLDRKTLSKYIYSRY